jgi:hypothetical protein
VGWVDETDRRNLSPKFRAMDNSIPTGNEIVKRELEPH